MFETPRRKEGFIIRISQKRTASVVTNSTSRTLIISEMVDIVGSVLTNVITKDK